MDNHVAPIAVLQLRLTETTYRSIADRLSHEDENSVFVVGLCGSTQVLRKDGYDAVATLFPSPPNLTATSSSISSISSISRISRISICGHLPLAKCDRKPRGHWK